MLSILRIKLPLQLFAASLLFAVAHAEEPGLLDRLKSVISGVPKSAPAESSGGKVEKSKGQCVNVAALRWRIVQRMDSGLYEVVTREAAGGNCHTVSSAIGDLDSCSPTFPEQRALLLTNADNFQSAGVIGNAVWLENDDSHPSTVELPLTNGFKKKYRVFKESVPCTVYGEQQAKEQREKWEQSQAASRQLATAKSAAELKQEKIRKVQEQEEQQAQEKAESLWK